jgi:hypothetical protein
VSHERKTLLDGIAAGLGPQHCSGSTERIALGSLNRSALIEKLDLDDVTLLRGSLLGHETARGPDRTTPSGVLAGLRAWPIFRLQPRRRARCRYARLNHSTTSALRPGFARKRKLARAPPDIGAALYWIGLGAPFSGLELRLSTVLKPVTQLRISVAVADFAGRLVRAGASPPCSSAQGLPDNPPSSTRFHRSQSR